MKFIVSTFSPKMFLDAEFTLNWHKLSEEEFHALMLDAYSCVGYSDVALMLNVAHNEEPVKARIGDTLLLADMNKGKLEYWCIQVYPCEFKLLREELEELIDEEMF